jgi:hypothetical protein
MVTVPRARPKGRSVDRALMSDLTRIKIEHREGCWAVELDPAGCKCEPIVSVQDGGKNRGWSSMTGALRLGWTRGDYERDVKQWVDDHQRPTTNAENEKILREKMTELRGDQP